MISLHEMDEWIKKLNGWDLDVNVLVKNFSFNSFVEATEFANKLSSLCTELNHFPDILISENTVKLTLFTKLENSLSKKDFELAELIDREFPQIK